MNQTGISSYTEPQLAELVKEMGQPAFRAKQLFKWLHEKQARSFSAMTDQPKAFLAALEERFFIETLETERRQQSKDGTVKYLFRLPDGKTFYNDVVRWLFDALYEMNVECDMLFPEDENFGDYDVLLVPALYTAPRALLERIKAFAAAGGELVATFKTAFSDENLKVYPETQPAVLSECFGIAYDEFTVPENVGVTGEALPAGPASVWMELVRPEGASVLAHYNHKFWGEYAAVTENAFGSGHATYLATMTTPECLKAVLERVLKRAGVWGVEQQAQFPLIIKSGVNQAGKNVRFYFNYSGEDAAQAYLHADGTELLGGEAVRNGDTLQFEPWGFKIIEEA